MDPELLQLQKLFQAAQEAKASVRLSERNVVELVSKLQELRLLDHDLLHTVSGREYLTQDHLRAEMELEIERLHRVSLIELATTIGVDLYYCERQAEAIVAVSPELMMVQGEILSKSYWDGVAEEINESLQESNQVSLAEVAARLNVGVDILKGTLEPRLGKIIHGKLEGGQLYTQAHVTRIQAMIRGAIRAIMVPTNLSTVWSSVQQQLVDMNGSGGGVTGEGALFQSLFIGLLKEGAFSGSLHSGGSVWTPAVFEKAQHEGVETFFSQNSYISYDMVRRFAISQPKQFLQAKYPDGVALDTGLIHSSFIEMVDAAAEEAVDSGHWFDCASMAPLGFTSADMAKVVSLCPSVQRSEKESKAKVLAETCVVSLSFLKGLSEILESEVKELARTRLFEDPKKFSIKLPQRVGESEIDLDVSNSSSSNGPESKAGKRKNAKFTPFEGLGQDMPSGKGTKGKKKGGKARGGSTAGAAASLKGGKEDPSFNQGAVLSEDLMATRIIELFPEIEGAGTDEEGADSLAKGIAAYLKPMVFSAWEEVRQASFTKAAEERRLRAEKIQSKVNELYAHLQLFSKALDIFEHDQTTLVSLHRHLLRTTAAELADLVLQMQDLEQRSDDGEICNGSESNTLALNNSQRLSLAKGLNGSLSRTALKMVEALDGKVINTFTMAFQEFTDECGLRVKQLDKKTEKALLLSYRKGLASEIEEEDNPISLLPKVVALLFAQVYNKALQAPGRAIAAAISHLKNGVSDVDYTTLTEYQSATVVLLSMLSTSTPGEPKMAHQDRVHKLPFMEEERQKYMLNLEIQAYSELHFRTVHNLSRVVAQEEAVKQIIERCNMAKYVEKVEQRIDHARCIKFLRTFDSASKSATVTLGRGEVARQVQVPLSKELVEKALGLESKATRRPKRDVFAMLKMNKGQVLSNDGVSIQDIPNDEVRMRAKVIHTLFSSHRYTAYMGRINVLVLESLAANAPEEID